MKTVKIKGKEYVEVNERIKYFRSNYKGSIQTEMLSNEGGVCVFKATVFVEGELVSNGHAYEKENSTFINKTSYIENCETSAIGRALGNFGIGIDTSVASYEEVANAIQNQKKDFGQKEFDNLKKKKESGEYFDYIQVTGIINNKYKVSSEWEKKIENLYK